MDHGRLLPAIWISNSHSTYQAPQSMTSAPCGAWIGKKSDYRCYNHRGGLIPVPLCGLIPVPLCFLKLWTFLKAQTWCYLWPHSTLAGQSFGSPFDISNHTLLVPFLCHPLHVLRKTQLSKKSLSIPIMPFGRVVGEREDILFLLYSNCHSTEYVQNSTNE